jgi:DNA polymerase III subunit epsilon
MNFTGLMGISNMENSGPTGLYQHSEMALFSWEWELLARYFPNGVVALDLETTGLSPLIDRPIEISAIKCRPDPYSPQNGTLEFFDELIDPEIDIPPHTILIHKITDSMVKGKPTIEQILIPVLSFFEDLPIIAHNAKIDLGFIMFDALRLNYQDRALTPKMNPLSNEVFCSCKMARSLLDAENYKLQTLLKTFDISVNDEHRALADAYGSLKILIQCLKAYEDEATSGPTLKDFGKIFSLSEFHHHSIDTLPPQLEILQKKTQNQHVVEIKYRGGHLKNEYRPVKALSLLNTPEGNILYAHCLISDMHKSFFLKKILDVRLPSAEDISRWYKTLAENRSLHHRSILKGDELEIQ